MKQWKVRFRRPMKMEVSESTLLEAHCIFRNSEENWGEEETFPRKEEETFSCRWFQQNRKGFGSLHELPTRSWQAFLGGRGRKRKKKRRKEDQEFFLRLMQALNKWNRYFHTGLLLLSKLQSYFVTELKTESNRKLSLFNFQWTKILYQNNIGFFFTFFKG